MDAMDDVDRSILLREVGGRIRHWRLQRDLRQAEVARGAGITQATLSNYETGKRDVPLPALIGMASVLNVSIGELVGLREVIVVRDSLLGRAVEELQSSARPRTAEAAS